MSLHHRPMTGRSTNNEGSTVTDTTVRRRPRTLQHLGAAGAVVAAAAMGVTLSLPTHHGFAATADQRLTTFAYRSGNVSMRVQLDPGSANFGAVLLMVPGQGVLRTAHGITVTKNSDTDTQLRFDGDALVDPAATADTEFHVTYQPSGQVKTTHLVVVGGVDPLHHTSAVQLFIGSSHYNLKTSAVAMPSAQPVVDTLLKQIAAAD